MLTDTKKNLNNTIYGRANLPYLLDIGTKNINYQYNASDMRIYKKVDSSGTVLSEEYYLRDATGRELAVIDDEYNVNWYIYGKERVASIRSVPAPELNVKVWLEGTYQSDSMTTNLNRRGMLPGQIPQSPLATPTPAGQPYNTNPWMYEGTETLSNYAPTVVDWVLLSLRIGLQPTDEIFRTAALLHNNGQVQLAPGKALPRLTDSVYVVIEHRNHSGIISPQKIPLTDNTLTYDFTLANSYTTSAAGQKQIASGIWGMFAGNAVTTDNQDDITGADKISWEEANGNFNAYTPSDFNLDADVNGADKVLWYDNNGTFSALQGSRAGLSSSLPAEIPDFVYYLYDHLGNTRVTYSVDLHIDVGVDAVQVRRTVESVTDYYPYGKALRSYGKERYQSTYHERDVESGFDYRGARFYDSDVARFNSLDPLAADYPEWSDYSYVLGNPLVFIDPTGEAAEWIPTKDGNLVAEKDDNALTLSDHLGVSYNEADEIFSNIQNWENKTGKQEGITNVEGRTLLIDDKSLKAGNIAEFYIGSKDWNTDVERGDFGEGANKCNVFCGEVLTQAGISPGNPNVINPGWSRIPFVSEKHGPPLAGQWADANYSIPDWRVLAADETPKRGDIAAYSFNFSNASGHVAIVAKDGFTVGTSGSQKQIAKTDFGFNPVKSQNLPVVFRRYTGN